MIRRYGRDKVFTRDLGVGAGQIQWTAADGFAAYGADRSVNLGGAATTVTWGSGSFVPDGSNFILGNAGATHTVTFVNPIDLNGAQRTVQAIGGEADVAAILSGPFSMAS